MNIDGVQIRFKSVSGGFKNKEQASQKILKCQIGWKQKNKSNGLESSGEQIIMGEQEIIRKNSIFGAIVIQKLEFYEYGQYSTLIQMNHTLGTEKKAYIQASKTVCAGAVASLITQPFQVLKTNMIDSPSLYIKDLHAKIITKGWKQYMRGGTLAVIRQGYGFTIYTSMISYLNNKMDSFSSINKYYKYSIAAFLGKLTAMFFQAPLTLLKTRMEVVSDSTIRQQIKEILKNPRQQMCKGLNATLVRQSVFSLIHYNAYRFLKDDVFKAALGIDSAFYPAFLAGTVAITISQPFEVLRSKVSLEKNVKMVECAKKIWTKQGWKGFFIGFMPRLIRKPINSGICWTILETVKEQ